MEKSGVISSVNLNTSRDLLLCSINSSVYVINMTDSSIMGELADHKAPINSIALSEHYYLTGSDDKTAVVWDSATFAPITVLKGHTKEISHVFICKDEKYCLTTSNDQTIRFWDMRTGRCIQKIEGFSSPISAIDFDVKFTKLLLSTWNSNNVNLWNLESNRRLEVEYCCSDYPESCAISENGNLLLSGIWDGSVVAYLVDNPATIQAYKEHSDIVSSIKISRDCSQFVSGSWDKTARLWSIKEHRCICVITGHKDIVTDVNISDDNEYILTASADRTAMICNTISNTKRILSGHKKAVTSIAASQNNNLCITGSEDTSAIIWSLSTGEKRITLDGHRSTISYVVFLSNNVCVTCSWDNTAKIWDATNGALICTYAIPDSNVSQIIWKFPYCIVNRSGIYEVWKADTSSYTGRVEKCNTIYAIDKLFISKVLNATIKQGKFCINTELSFKSRWR